MHMPKFRGSDNRVGASNQARGEYLTHGNQQTLQIKVFGVFSWRAMY